jgi:2-iminobutanoate/2-iminopropanoate deaminase
MRDIGAASLSALPETTHGMSFHVNGKVGGQPYEKGTSMQTVHPGHFPTPAVPLSHGVRAGDLFFVSGQVATGPDGAVLVGDFEAEVNSAIDNVEAVLHAGGATLADVVKVGAFLSNAALFAPFNEIYARRIGDVPPARTTVVVGFGHPDVRVEIEAIAHLGK